MWETTKPRKVVASAFAFAVASAFAVAFVLIPNQTKLVILSEA
jgi:hypothetical protein